jgi:hypothetical protein
MFTSAFRLGISGRFLKRAQEKHGVEGASHKSSKDGLGHVGLLYLPDLRSPVKNRHVLDSSFYFA